MKAYFKHLFGKKTATPPAGLEFRKQYVVLAKQQTD